MYTHQKFPSTECLEKGWSWTENQSMNFENMILRCDAEVGEFAGVVESASHSQFQRPLDEDPWLY